MQLSGAGGADWLDFIFDTYGPEAEEGSDPLGRVKDAAAQAADALAAVAGLPLAPPPQVSRPPGALEAIEVRRAQALVHTALGSAAYPRDSLSIRTVHSDKACAIVLHDRKRNVVVVAFRGTKDPIDLLTDITFFSSPFAPRPGRGKSLGETPAAILAAARGPVPGGGGAAGGGAAMEVHTGFLNAFDSIRGKIDDVLEEVLAPPATANAATGAGAGPATVLLTGHSMGGALAQLASAYYADLAPRLVTFAAPAVGNADFCRFVDRHVQVRLSARI